MANDDNEPLNKALARGVPDLIISTAGRTVSRSGLIERILEQFSLEHGERDSDAIRHAKSEVARRQLVRDSAHYVLAVESIQLEPSDLASILNRVYADVFGYSVLDSLFADESITTIALEGSEKISVRYGVAQALVSLAPIFDDLPHMRRILARLLSDAGAMLSDEQPIIEAGLIVHDRRISISTVIPPLAPHFTADIRLHPTHMPTLDDWVERGILDEASRQLLVAIVQSEHGLLVVGDTESGKTTLLSMLLHCIGDQHIHSVERTGELAPTPHMQRYLPQWSIADDERISFGDQVMRAVQAGNPQTLVIDEVRADEPHTIMPLLTDTAVPRQIWSFRGTAEPKRLASALGMLARMAHPQAPEKAVYQLYQRLPFIVILKRRQGTLRVHDIAEWQFTDNDDYASYTTLIRYDWDHYQMDSKPMRALSLPDDFWD